MVCPHCQLQPPSRPDQRAALEVCGFVVYSFWDSVMNGYLREWINSLPLKIYCLCLLWPVPNSVFSKNCFNKQSFKFVRRQCMKDPFPYSWLPNSFLYDKQWVYEIKMCSCLMCFQLTLVGRCNLTWQPISKSFMGNETFMEMLNVLHCFSLCHDAAVWCSYNHWQMRTKWMENVGFFFVPALVILFSHQIIHKRAGLQCTIKLLNAFNF